MTMMSISSTHLSQIFWQSAKETRDIGHSWRRCIRHCPMMTLRDNADCMC